MKTLLTLVSLFAILLLFGQADVVEKRLEEYGVRTDFLEHSLRNTKESYVYKYKMTYGAMDGTPVVNISEYDPRRKLKNRWQLITVNGKLPSKKELRKWNKFNNERGEELHAEIDKSTYEVVVDNPTYFSFSFKYKPETVSKNRQFLADCIGYAYYNKQEKKITGVRYENFRETKVRLYNCHELVISHELDYDQKADVHLITSEDFDFKVMVVGQEIELEQLGEYFDYEKIK